MTSALVSPATRQDLVDAINWIAKDNPSAARALRESVVRIGMTIGEHPKIGSLRPEIVQTPFRCLPLPSFPYVVIFHPDRRPPVTVRILHGARDLPEILRDL